MEQSRLDATKTRTMFAGCPARGREVNAEDGRDAPITSLDHADELPLRRLLAGGVREGAIDACDRVCERDPFLGCDARRDGDLASPGR